MSAMKPAPSKATLVLSIGINAANLVTDPPDMELQYGHLTKIERGGDGPTLLAQRPIESTSEEMSVRLYQHAGGLDIGECLHLDPICQIGRSLDAVGESQ